MKALTLLAQSLLLVLVIRNSAAARTVEAETGRTAEGAHSITARSYVASPGCLGTPTTSTVLTSTQFTTFFTPGYDQGIRFPNNNYCSWLFQGPANAKLELHCNKVYVQFFIDSLTIKDGAGRVKHFGFMFGSPFTYKFSGNVAEVGISTDKWFRSKGFSCTMDVVDPSGPPPVPNPNTDCECGVKKVNTRIVGGQETEVNEYPWMVGFQKRSRPGQVFCGGALISDRHILSAAHCLIRQRVEDLKFSIGDHNLNDDDQTDELIDGAEIILHADYDEDTLEHDIALVRIFPLDFQTLSVAVRPVCLPADTSEDYVGEYGTVTGWGTTLEGGSISTTLLEVDVPIISNADCNALLTSGSITTGMMCAGTSVGGYDACQGDSGGPFVLTKSGVTTQIGVVSWGIGCARPNKPGVYTRVTEYLDWIAAKATNAETCVPPS